MKINLNGVVVEIDEHKTAASGECCIKGCSKPLNPGGCCFCAEHHPEHAPPKPSAFASASVTP